MTPQIRLVLLLFGGLAAAWLGQTLGDHLRPDDLQLEPLRGPRLQVGPGAASLGESQRPT